MLNSTNFTLIAGNPEPWDAEIRDAKADGGDFDLCEMQVEQHGRGRRSAHMVPTIHGWSVRLASGLDERQLLLGGYGQKHTFAEAVRFGIGWANECPDSREFYVSNRDLDKARRAGEDIDIIQGVA